MFVFIKFQNNFELHVEMKGKGKYFFNQIERNDTQDLKSHRLSIFNGMQLTSCDEHLSVLSLGTMYVAVGVLLGHLIKIIGYVFEQGICANSIGKTVFMYYKRELSLAFNFSLKNNIWYCNFSNSTTKYMLRWNTDCLLVTSGCNTSAAFQYLNVGLFI